MNSKIVRTLSAACLATLVVAAIPAVAQSGGDSPQVTETGFRSGVVIAKKEATFSLWTRRGRDVFQLTGDTVLPQRSWGEGSMVVVKETQPGSKVAEKVILVDEEVWVEAKGTRERAIIGRFEPSVTSPSHMIIRTARGKEAFVIDPKTFRQPFPQPNQRVALTYRVENVTPPIYKATGLVLLPDSFDDSPVKVTYQEIPKPAPAPAPAPATAPAAAPVPAPEPVAALPQTASQLPALALLGLLLVAGGFVYRLRGQS